MSNQTITQIDGKPVLNIVIVDQGSLADYRDGSTSTPITPELINATAKKAFIGSKAMKIVFLDARGIDKDGGVLNFDKTITEWKRFSFFVDICPRKGSGKKESIDSELIERINALVELFQKEHSLHFILVVSDVDYEPKIRALLEAGIRVSLICTRSNTLLEEQLVAEYQHTFYLFPVVERSANQFKTTGFSTAQSMQQTASWLSTLDPNALLNWTVEWFHKNVIPSNMRDAFEMMPVIPWSVVDVILSVIRIQSEEPVGTLVDDIDKEHARFLAYASVIERIKDRYHIVAGNIRSIEQLIEEVHSRASHVQLMRKLSPEGAIPEPALRKTVLRAIKDPSVKAIHQDISLANLELWATDTALNFLTHPNNSVEQYRIIERELDPVHAVRLWKACLLELPHNQWVDMLELSEHIAKLAKQFFSERSVAILVTNQFLEFDSERQQLRVNTGHPLFLPLAKGVAA